jgi:hypothetical protein
MTDLSCGGNVDGGLTHGPEAIITCSRCLAKAIRAAREDALKEAADHCRLRAKVAGNSIHLALRDAANGIEALTQREEP